MSDWESAPSVIDDNTRRFLDFLGKAEGADYNTIVGGKSFNDYSAHPNVVGLRTKEGPSTAAGKYQILKSTYDDVAPRLGISDFSPESQDRIAVELIKRAGALEDIQKGDYNSAIGKLGKTWASLPSSPYSQPKRSAEWVQKVLDTVITPAYAGEKPTQLPAITVPATQVAPAASVDDGWETAPTKVATPAPAPDDWETAPSPAPVAGGSPKPALSATPTVAPKSALRKVDDFVRGLADTATFGYADEIAAGLDRFFGINTGKQGAVPKTYDEALAAQRALDKEGGGERIVGQVAGAFVPGAGTKLAVNALPNASRLARFGAGAATGAMQGALYGSGSAEGDLGDRVSNAATMGAVGALTGGVLGAALPSTVRQEANTLINKAGGEERARIEAEVIKDFLPIANNPNLKAAATDAETATVAAALRNQKVNSYFEDVKKALKRVDPGVLKKYDVEVALSQNKVIAPEALDAIRTAKNGNILADAIEKAQIARSITAPTPASSSFGAKVARFGIEYAPKAVAAATGASTFGPAGIAAALLTPRTSPGWAQRLTGKQTIPEVISKMASDKQQAIADEVLNRLGPSAASKGSAALADMARRAEQATAAKAQAMAQAKAAQAAQDQATRIGVLQQTRRPLSGGFQELLPGGRANTNMTSGEAIDALRLIKRQGGPVGEAADQILKSKPVSNQDAFYGLQNALRGLQERGILSGAPQASAAAPSAIRNPISYAEAVRTAGEAANLARSAAPSKELAQFATKIAGTKGPADKAKLLADRLAKATDPNEIAFLNQFVEPLTKFGAK